MQLFVKLTQPDFAKKASISKKPQLLVIPYSHFCELASWAAELKKFDHELHRFAPGQHIMPVLSVRVFGNEKHIAQTSHVAPVNADNSQGASNDASKKKGSGETSVPLMVMPNGKVLGDSWSIVNECGFEPLDQSSLDLYDRVLGPDTRQLAYYYLLKPSNQNVWNGLCTDGYSFFWRTTWGAGFGGLVTKKLRDTFAANDPSAVTACRERLAATFEAISTRVRGRSGRYLAGDVIGTEDLALAGLAAPVLMPAEYCGGVYRKWFDMLEAQDQELQAELVRWRGTDAGKFAMEIYRDHRVRPAN